MYICWLGIQLNEFDAGDAYSYGDFTDYGTIAEKEYKTIFNVQADEDLMTTYEIKCFSDAFQCFGDYTAISKSISGLDIPLDQDEKYYIYLWSDNDECVYPDTLILTIEVKDGEVIIKDPAGTVLEENSEINNTEETQATKNNTLDIDNPKTGDTIILYFVLGAVSIVAMFYLTAKRK